MPIETRSKVKGKAHFHTKTSALANSGFTGPAPKNVKPKVAADTKKRKGKDILCAS